MRISRRLAVPFAVVACVAAASWPQPSPDAVAGREVAILRGRVSDLATGAPLAEARVRIANTTTATITDSLGRYQMRDAPAAECTVVIARVGYYRQQHDIILSSTRPETLDVALRRSRRSVY